MELRHKFDLNLLLNQTNMARSSFYYYQKQRKAPDKYKVIKQWIKSRLEERTSWDGAMLIGVGVIVLIAGPFAKLAAYGAIAYGAWTIWKRED